MSPQEVRGQLRDLRRTQRDGRRDCSLRTPSSQEFGQVTIVSEERHELSDHSAMSVHQVRIELPVDVDADRVVVLAEHWGGVHR